MMKISRKAIIQICFLLLTAQGLLFLFCETIVDPFSTYEPSIIFLSDRYRTNNPFDKIDIFSMNSDGSTEIRLTNFPGRNGFFQISPDGSEIVFDSDKNGNRQIFKMGIHGENLKQLTSDYDCYGAFYSPDGSKILYELYDQTTSPLSSDLYLMNIDGTQRTRLTYTDNIIGRHSFSPTGQQIIFEYYSDFGYQIYTINVDGSGLNQLTDTLSNKNLFPVYSPDGNKIIFVSYNGDKSDIYMMDSDGTNKTNLTNDETPKSSPLFSPEGDKIIFSGQPGPYISDDLYIMDVDGKNRRRLLDGLIEKWNYSPSYSKDGQRIVFLSGRDIYMCDRNGKNIVQLTASPFWDWNPKFIK
jgi:TolB protein